MVSFESSNYHGVEALTKGKRYALAMWFTLDPGKEEPGFGIPPHHILQKIMHNKKNGQESEEFKPEEPKDEL